MGKQALMSVSMSRKRRIPVAGSSRHRIVLKKRQEKKEKEKILFYLLSTPRSRNDTCIPEGALCEKESSIKR